MMAVSRLVLVRHAMPETDPGTPAPLWHLGTAGRAAARAMRPLLPVPAYLVASDEPKAVATLREMSGEPEIATDADVGEVRRPHVWSPRHRSLARSYVAGVCHEGWEPHDRVAARFDRAVVRHAAAATGRTLVIGTHGMAPTVWLASRMRLDPDPAEFWADLRFPDVLDVDLAAGTVRRVRGDQAPTMAG